MRDARDKGKLADVVDPESDEPLKAFAQLKSKMLRRIGIRITISHGLVNELDPTLLFPKPVELLEVTTDPVSTQSWPCDTSSSTSADTHTSPNSTTITPVAAPPRRKTRKDELEYLRVKAKELELQLQQLKSREVSIEQQEETVADVSVWRKVARRQFEGKKRAEKENGKLRGLVEGQLTIVQNLDKLLRKRSAMEESGAWANERKRTPALKKTDGQHMQVKPDGIYGMFMEFLASKILPFDVRTTVTQFWRCMAQPHLKLREGHYSLIDGTEDTLSAKMAFTVQYQQHQVQKDAWFAVKRFIEEDRCIFVWACETNVKGTLSRAQSMHHHDTGWTSIERYSGETTEICIIQTCVRVRTELPEVMPRSQEELMLLTDIVTSSFLENLDGIHQSVEDALIEDAMRK
ncbi:hypothetical protein GN958_ATG18378 [Phytophthora infestans]|uniref:M96 mating-specific protein family n=1 Tax=Phytophthora infestans TaxID=4787 RepID=A0A8S9U2J8_PHYIN|nr:hypothetical protein GN958_ATG18378 [Phytophthora infestans]